MSSEMSQESPQVTSDAAEPAEPAPKWRPLAPRQRRVLGVLVEKAKTTPDAYPMSVNAIVAGCNQKSNRSPTMNISPEDVEDVLVELRQFGVVAEVQQGGRVPRYRHYMRDWLEVDQFELAVIVELMLRGEQTIGELRGRASRMEPIVDLQTLRPILQSLEKKKLLLPLTPEGRGQIVTHNLYKEREVNDLQQRYAGGVPASGTRESDDHAESADDREASSAPSSSRSGVTKDMFAELQLDVAELRAEVARLRERLERLEN